MLKFYKDKDFRAFLSTNFSAFFMLFLLVLMITLVSVVIVLGMKHLWPSDVYTVEYFDNDKRHKIYAQIGQGWQDNLRQGQDIVLSLPELHRISFSRKNIKANHVISINKEPEVVRWQLHSGHGKLGRLGLIFEKTQSVNNVTLAGALQEVISIEKQISEELNQELIHIHKQIAQLNLKKVSSEAPLYQRYYDEYADIQLKLTRLREQSQRFEVEVINATGQIQRVNLRDVERFLYANQLNGLEKIGVAMSNFWRLLYQSPKAHFQAGGFFPAIFGTLIMVLLMTLFVTPLGVLVAVYLHEYAPKGWFTNLIRISVNNLAGVPSIVYGVFGLGFFVYGIGGSIDQLFYKEQLPSPTFGAPGLLWASLTMALLTLPVVIVATEEGLKRVPRNLLVGSYALGATKLETVWKIALPLASPGILTGIIMAMARGAGEVAPLLLVGAIKFAPLLPIDNQFPFIHLERQFMHLGSLIYHGTFNSLETEFGGSMIYVACMLLLLLVLCLNLIAMSVRNKLRLRYSTQGNE